MNTIPKLRCAVYTRKSSEEGLDQSFNSLDAQREACVAFIHSQASLGWKAVADHYDDGGISGGTMERPALKRLLDDIRARRIDIIVVYKIDRLTRSLMDFAKMVEIFDQYSVSFVSITQQFNTTTSMGRLTLNVLLSFAQFEREVTAERIRDKVAASKKKGMWMGGAVPLGYKAIDRKLVIAPEAARIVRSIFDHCLKFGSVPALLAGWAANGAMGPRPSRGKLYHVLSNPIYIGKIRHKHNVFEGEHKPIIDADMFDRVQKQLAEQARSSKLRAHGSGEYLLTGIIFDAGGRRLTPVHTNNHGKRYRYYVSDTRKDGDKNGQMRFPAKQLEAVVELKLQQLLEDQMQLMLLLDQFAPGTDIPAVLGKARELSANLARLSSNAKRDLVQSLCRRIHLTATTLTLEIDGHRLIDAIIETARSGVNPDDQSCRQPIASSGTAPAIVLTYPLTLKSRGVESRIVLAGGLPTQIDKSLVEGVGLAHACLKALTDGSARGIAEVALAFNIDASEVSRLLPLAFLAPSLTEMILVGRQPADLTLRKLTRLIDLPIQWQQQIANLAR